MAVAITLLLPLLLPQPLPQPPPLLLLLQVVRIMQTVEHVSNAVPAVLIIALFGDIIATGLESLPVGAPLLLLLLLLHLHLHLLLLQAEDAMR